MVRSGFREFEDEKLCFLPAAGRRTQVFYLLYTEPRGHHKVHPCSIQFLRFQELVWIAH